MARRAAPDEFSVTLTGVDLDADGLKLLVWLTAENSYWNNVDLWLNAERDWKVRDAYFATYGVPIEAGPEAALEGFARKRRAAAAAAVEAL